MVNVGIDLHKRQFTVCVRRSGGGKFWKYPTTESGYGEFLKRAAAWLRLKPKEPIYSGLGYFCFCKNKVSGAFRKMPSFMQCFRY